MDWDFEENIRLRGNWEDIRNPRAFRGVAVREKGKENEFSDANERGCSLVGERERVKGLLDGKKRERPRGIYVHVAFQNTRVKMLAGLTEDCLRSTLQYTSGVLIAGLYSLCSRCGYL